MRFFFVANTIKKLFSKVTQFYTHKHSRPHRRFIIATTMFALVSISALFITTTVESNLTFTRKLDRFLVLPGATESVLWNDTHHALTQDVRDDGLYQNFNNGNAATLDARALGRTPETTDASEGSLPGSDSVEADVVDSMSEDGVLEDTSAPETEDSTVPEVEPETETIPETDGNEPSEADSSSPSETDAPSTSESASSDTPLEAMSKGFFRFVERATDLLPFAQETIIEPVPTGDVSEPETEPEPATVDAPQEEPPVAEEIVPAVIDDETVEDENVESEESVEDTDTESLDDDASEDEGIEPLTPEIQPEPENWIVFRDFALPPMNSGQFIRNVQLRMSLAGALQENVAVLPQIAVEYTTGGAWEDAGSIIFDTEISNALNGGYYLFALPTFRNVSELEKFAVRVSYVGDSEALDELFIDAAWLEVNTETFDREILNQRLNPQSFKGFKLPEMYEYIGNAIDFAREELPQFTLKYESQRNPVVGFFRGLFARNLIEVERVAFKLPGGAEIHVDPEVDLTEDGLLSIQLTEEDKALLQPGKYEVEITVLEGNKKYTDSFNFQWGVLAINPDRTTYPVGTDARITMGAVSENGNTLCEAELQLYIFDPTGYVYDAPVQRSGLCNGNNVTDEPDYFADFTPTVPGTYEMYLEHIGVQGDVVAHTYDTFIVRDSAPLTMERTGPTRINPRFEYPMSITVTAHEAFEGEFIERVPADFVIGTSTDARIEERGNTQELIWDVTLLAGESRTFTYGFDAPDISPYLYNLGPARVLSGDGVVVYETAVGDAYLAQETVIEPVPEEPSSEAPVEETEVLAAEPVETETSPEPEESLPETPVEEVESEVPQTPETETDDGVEEIIEVSDDEQVLPDDVSEGESETVIDGLGTTTVDTETEDSKDFEEHRQWQIASDATGSALLYWSSATIPSGWTCVSCAPAGVFYQRFVVGSSTAGTNGGGTTHTHTMSTAVAATGATGVSSTGGGGADSAQNGHTHTLTPTIGTGSNLPPYRNLVIIQHNSAGSPATIPAGAITLFDTTLPAGWSAYAAQNGFFPRAEATSTIGTTGGSATHTHTITDTTSAPNSTTNAPGFSGVSTANNTHTHTINGASSAGANTPPYIGALFGQLATTSAPTDGMILMWTEDPPLGWNTVSSSSEPFENRFVVASTTYGVTGGSATHAHANFSITTSGPSGSANRTVNAANADASGAHTHSANFTAVSTADNLPPFRTAVFAKRAPGGAPPAAVTIHTPFDNEKTGTSSILFEFTGDDPDGSDTLVYQVQWDDDSDIATTPLGDHTSDDESGCSPDCFENIVDGGDTNPFTDNERIRFTAPSTMVSGTTYYYRIRVKETIGNTWSSWSTIRSVTYSSGTSPSEWFQTQTYQFGLGTSTNATTTGDAIQLASTTLASTPVVQSFTSNTAVPGASLTLTKPSNILAGDLLLIIVGSDDDTASAQWDDATLKPSGFTLINESGNTTADAHSAAFYRVADGTEGTTINVPAQSSDDFWGYYIHVTDVNPSNPIHVIGSAYNGGSTGTHNVPGVTTTAANALAFYVLSGDGGDLDPFSVGGAWTEGGEIGAGTGGGNGSGVWGTRLMTSPGATGNAAVTMSASDSASGFQFALAPAQGQGAHQSSGAVFTSIAGQTAWGEATWNATEPPNTDVRVRVLYSNVSTCDTLVSDGVLPGNSIGFSSSQKPIDLTSLSTSTHHTICLEALLDIGSGTTSPILEDWTVRWTRTPQFAQSDYRWYANNDTLTPTDPWPVGGDDLNENEPIDAENIVGPGDVVRLRLSLLSTSTDAAVGSASFKLQHGTTDSSCAAVTSWSDVGGTSSTTAPWRGYNNASVSDGSTLPSTLLAASDFAETYEEQNNSFPNPIALDTGEIGEWDWTLEHNGADAGRIHCFRMVNANDDPLMEYTQYPSLITDGSPSMILYRPFDNEKTSSTTPWFEFVSDDPEGDDVDYQIQIDNDASFGSTIIDTDSVSNLLDFTNLVTPSDKSPFRVAERMRYRIPSALSNGTTYWWRARSIDAAGSGAYGEWSTARSFTIDTSVTVSTWFQTTEAQFDTNTLIGTDATGGNLVAFASGSTTGTTTSTAIDFDDVVIGNAWGEFSFNETGSANNILYRLEYYDGADWSLIPDTALAGNSSGFDTSPIDLLNLDSSIYNTIRIHANFLAGTPTLLDWTIAWGERVSVPTHAAPFDNEKFSTTTPFFTFSTTDPQGDDLEYEISWSTDVNFVTGSTTRNSSVNAGFVNLTSGGDTDPFNSGDTIQFQIQPADILTASTTYWWRVRAKDPGDSDSFSFWSAPWSFTTATSGESIDVSTWHQTTEQQFSQGTLSSVTATSGSVSIGSGITVQSWNTNTAVPGNSLSLTKPTGVAAGDLLLIIVGNDDTTGTEQWNSTTFRPSGFSFIGNAGSATPDAHVAAFYRIADGTESAATSTPAQSSDDYWGYYIHVTGVSTTSPIDVIGADYAGGSLTTHNIPGVTTSVDQALAFYVLSGDGGDLNPFSVGGAWTERAETEAGAGAGNASGVWGTRLMASAGATGNASVTMSAADGAAGFQFALSPSVITSGTVTSQPIDYDSGDGPAWGEFTWNDIEPGASEILYSIEYLNMVGVWELIPDGALPGNSTGFTSAPVDLESLNTGLYNTIRLTALLDCDGANCPTLTDWTVTWSSGFTISGTAYEYDGTASTTSGTVAIAVDGVLQSGKTGTISNGLWSIPGVTFFTGDVITVFVQSATNADEAVAVTTYDGTPGISGLSLIKRHLTIGSDDLPSISNADLALYDFTNTEDIFFDVNGGNDLSLCADTGCVDASLRILSGASYAPGTGGDIVTHDFRNDGTFTPGSNTMRVSGSWDNNSTTTMTNSTVIFTATSSDVTSDPWYNPAWGYRAEITVAAAEVDADVSDFPVYVDLSDLDATFFSTVTSDGGDIRVTTADSVTELPREIVSINTGLQTGEIYFQADNLSSSSDTVFYIYYNNPLANDYAVGDPYGRNAVWDNGYAAVYHMEEDPGGGAPQYVDSTGSSAGTAVNMASGNQVAGIVGNAAEVDGVNESIQTTFSQSMLDSTWSLFLDADGTQGACDGAMVSRGTGVNGMNIGACGNTALIGYHWENLAGTAWNWVGGPAYPTNQWFMASLVITPTQATAYAHTLSGVTSGSNVQTHTTSNIDNLDFGWDSFGVARSFDGTIDEARLSDVARSADWLATEYNNISDTTAFYDAASSESYASIGSSTSPYTLDDADGVLDFDTVTFGEGSGTAAWSINDTLDADSALAVTYGTLARGAEQVFVAGNLTTSANGFWTGMGTTTFDGINPSTWTDSNATKQNIGRVVVNGTSKTMLLGSNVVMDSMRIETDDTFDLSTSGYTASVHREWTNIGSFLPRNGTVAFIATSSTYAIQNGASAFYNLTFNGAGGAWSFATATLTVQNNFTIATGTVTMPTGTTTISGSFLNTGGTFAHNNANVLFAGSGTKTITQSGTAFTNAFYNVRFTGSGSWSFSEANATTTNNFTITQGTVTFSSSTLAIGNSFAQTGGSFAHNSGAVRFTGSGTHTIDVNGSSFNDLAFTGSGSWSFLDTSLTVLGDVLVQSGTLTMPTGTLSLGGSLTNLATIAHASGTVLFNSTDAGETINLGNSPLHNTTFNSAGGGWTITENATTTGSTTLSALSSFTLASGRTLSVTGAFTNSVGGASTTWSGSTLSLESGNYSINTKLQSGDAYDTLRVGANADVRMWFSTSTTYAVNAAGSLYSQDHAGVDGDLYIWGTYERTSGTEYWSYATDFDGTALGGSSRQVDIRFADGADATFTGSTLQIRGISMSTTTVAAQEGLYSLALSNATLDAEYYHMRHLTLAGLELLSGTTVSSFQHGHFVLDTLGGSAITVDQSVIDANPALQISDVRFDTSVGGSGDTTTGNGDDTFLFFDDFNDSSINTGKWTRDIELGALTETGGYLRAGGGITSGNYGHVSLGSEVAYDDFLNNSVVWRARNSVDGIGELVFRGDFGTNGGYKTRFDARTGTNGQAVLTAPYSGWNFAPGANCGSDSDEPVANQWYNYEVTALSTNFILYRDGVSKRNCTDASYALPGEIALQNHYGSYTDYDWVAVRPLVNPEPASTSWGAEEEVSPGLYREPHVITGSVAGAQNDYVLPIVVNFATGTDSGATMYCNGICNADFSDVRFTTAEGAALDYWREDSYVASTSARFWVKFDDIPASPATTTMYAYYGDLGARNVTQIGGTPGSYWWFRGSAGDIDGEAFDNDTGNPGSVRWDDSQLLITVAGTVYSDDGVTTMGAPVCDGSTQSVRIVVNGGSSYTGSCNASTGAFSIANVAFSGDPILTAYLDTNGGARGVTVTKTPTGNLTNFNIYQNRVITRHEDVTPMTILDMAVFDADNDADVPFTAATGTLSVFANAELHIASSTTFAPGGDITIHGNASSSVTDGSLHIDDNAHLLGAATSTYTIAGSFTMDQGASFTAASTTVIMNATTTGKTITTPGGQEITFNALRFTGAGGGWNINGDIRAYNGISIENGTVSGTANITVLGGSLSGNGTLSMGGGTTTIVTTNTLGGTAPWTLNNLVLGNGSIVGTTTSATNATTTILSRLTIRTGHAFAPGGGRIDLRGSGTVFVESGVFVEGTSTVRYSGTAGSNVLSTTYYGLEVMALGNAPTFTGTGLGIVVLNDLAVGGATTTTFTLDTSDPALDVNGAVRINTTGTLVGSASAAFTVGGGWDNDGVFTASGGTVTFDGGSATLIAAGNSSFANAVIGGAGSFTFTEHATTTGALTLSSAGALTVQSGQTLAVGGTFLNNIGGAATTWTGSTLSLYGGGNYTINASTTSDSYNTLRVLSGTQIRMWNSDATAYDIAATGSLYSQDHGNNNGELRIFGLYQKTSGTDHWSYATDFDGTSISGSPRAVSVLIANTATVTIAGGGLSVIGGTGATTTITNQGSGTYALTVGGTASTTWSRFSIRNTNALGLTFAGTPTVSSLAFGDFEVAQNGASGMTVGGTVITQNPAKTFTNMRFGTSTGVTSAYNVTATGTTVSSWRFTNHVGTIAGESFDNDPTGDPGYLVWDDSAALITVSGTVYSDEGVTVSGVCDSTTPNVHVRVAGLTSYTTSCHVSTGAYSIPNISFGPADSIIVFIEGETEKAATVTVDPVSNITNMNLYENRVIVRHENSSPISITDMDAWDSGDNADIPFTATLGAPNTLSLPANRKLIIWTNKEFEPTGNVTVAGGGGGAAYDGTVELYAGATFDASGSESHTIGGSLLMGAGASFDDESSTVTFTTSGAGRTIDSNDQSFYNAVFNGSGSWTVTNSVLSIGNDLTITQGIVTLPSGTTTISGSLLNNGGAFVSSGGTMVFDSGTAETIRPRTSSFGTLIVSGNGNFTLSGGFATTTSDLRIDNGSFTSATGTFAIGGNFINNDVFTHANGTLRLTSNSAAVVTASSSDLRNITFAGDGPYTFTDTNLAILGTLRIEDGAVALPIGTLSIGGSLLNVGGTFNSATGTVLFNSTDTGESVNPGPSPFFNVTFGSASGGWTITAHATSTGNFALTSASQFTVSSSTRLHVGGIFTNLVGGGATTWTGSTLSIHSGTGYTINTKTAGGDAYNILVIGSSTALRAWDSSGTVSMADSLSSFYSQDHAGVAGTLNIYGDYARTAGTDYWSYATDFDGAALGGGSRQVSVAIAQGATTTFAGNASLQIVGANGFETSVSNQGSGTYALRVLGGTFNALQYMFANMDAVGLALQGTTTVSSLSEGSFTLAVNGGTLISLASTTLNYNAGLVVTNTVFATTSAITGFNVALTGTTLNAWTFIGHSGNLDGEQYDFDGGDACGSVRWEDSLCLLTQQSGYRFRADDGGAGVPNSEWLDLDWVKRMRVTFTNNDAVSYTNAAVAFTVPYDSDMQADFDDLRFTLADGTTPVQHFIETYSAGVEAHVWVKVPLLATSTNTSVFMYYGDGAVGDSSATSTFTYLDTFEDGNISEYSGDTGLFTAGTTMNYERNRGLDAAGNESQKTTDGIYRTNVTVAQGQTIRYLQYVDTALGSGDETCTLFGVQSPGSNNQNYAVCLELYGVDRVSIARNVDSNDTSGTILASTTLTYSTGWYEVEIDWGTDDSIGVTVSKDDVVVASTTVTDGTYTQGGVGFAFWFQSGGWDIYSSRPLLATEPSFVFGAEQVPGGASWLSALNTAYNGSDIGQTMRVRFLVENTGLSIIDQNYELEYAAKGAAPSCEAVASGAYVPVPPQASCGSSPVCMTTSSQFTNFASTVDLLGGDGAFSAGQLIEDPDNTTGDIDVAMGAFTELEYAITPTVNVADPSYCLRVSDEGNDLDAYARVAEFSLMFEPIITTLSLNGGNDIILAAGATTTITATGTVSDLNGYADLAAATTTIFRSGAGESCAADNNNCYIAAPAQCTYSNCAGASCTISCSVNMYYHADPTDIGAYAGETWRALLSISDVGGSVATATAPSIDLLTLRALSVANAIDYGALAPDSNTGSYNATTTIQNIGNDSIDVSVEGTDLTDGGSSLIPVASQRFATSTFTYSSCVVCGTLAETGTNFMLDLAKPASTTPPVTDDLFWGLAIPFGVAGTPHHGTNIFYAIGDI